LIGGQGESGSFGKRIDAAIQISFRGESVFHLGKGGEGGLFKFRCRELEFGIPFRYVGPESTTLENGLGEIAGDAPHAEVRVQEVADVITHGAITARETEGGKERSLRFEKAFVGGGDAALGGGEVGSSVQQGGGQVGGNPAW
jgi:hypothetical protein